MKIAIFGDSYASTRAHKGIDLYKGWPELLAEKYDVTHFADNGSSLYYSKKIFDSKYDQFDKIIFCITAPGRIEFKIEKFEGSRVDPWYRHIPTIWTIDKRLEEFKDYLTPFDRKRYKILYDYILEVQDIEYEEYIQTMMINDIKNKRPDAMLIPCFKNSIPNENFFLELITIMEDAVFKKRTGFYNDKRKCHMTYENNLVLFQKIVECLENNKNKIDLSIEDFQRPNEALSNLLGDI